MTRLDPPATPEEDAAAAAMWEVWRLGGHSAARTWPSESDAIRDMWRTYARAALPAAHAVGDLRALEYGLVQMIPQGEVE